MLIPWRVAPEKWWLENDPFLCNISEAGGELANC